VKLISQFVKNSQLNSDVLHLAQTQMAEKLNHDTELCEKLIPKFEVGCRRITPGEGYLESFLRPNVHLTQSPITKVTNSGIRTADGNFHEVDISMALSAPRLQNLVNVG
jgi:cation diffusion facilitator CzcD-associated flavoprotein CzcO